jgi:hypothetical protein
MDRLIQAGRRGAERTSYLPAIDISSTSKTIVALGGMGPLPELP